MLVPHTNTYMSLKDTREFKMVKFNLSEYLNI